MITLPIYWTKNFKSKPDKVVLVGMNWYRNAHHFDQNNLKREFSELVHNQLPPKVSGQYTLDIKLYYKNPSCDGSNICALMEKIVLDALQEDSILEQDNVKFHLGTTWSVVGQDKLNPRCEITIKEL